MNRELKNRVESCDHNLDQKKDQLKRATALLSNEIFQFGEYRCSVLKDTIGRFKNDMIIIGKYLEGGGYDIPESIETPQSINLHFEKYEMSEKKKDDIFQHASQAILSGSEGVMRAIAKRNNVSFNPNTNNNYGTGQSGVWWLDLVVAGVGLFSDIADKRAKEEARVERYEAETSKLIKKTETQIEFCHQIIRRIKELIEVSDDLKLRCVNSLWMLEQVINEFNVNDNEHIAMYQKAAILIKGISELAKVEIIDSNNEISQSDSQYIIKSKQLLMSSI